MLEHVAHGIEKDCDEVPTRTHSVIEWAKICCCSTRRLRQFCDLSTELRLICAETAPELRQFGSRRVADRLQIDIPKLLKYRDEYSKKSGQTPAQDREQITTEKITIKPKSSAPPRTAVKVCDSDAWFSGEFWPAWPVKQNREPARKAAAKIPIEARPLVIAGLLVQSPRIAAMERPIHASTWLNARRWEDEQQSPGLFAVGAVVGGTRFQPKRSFMDDVEKIMGDRIARGEKPL